MGRPKKWKDPEKYQQALLLNKTVIFKLKAYGVETGQPFDKVIKIPLEKFEKDLLELARSIDEIRQQAYVSQNPITPQVAE